MKKLIYGGLFLALIGVTVIACDKYSSSSTPNEESSTQSNEKIGPGFRIFKVELHRKAGKINDQGQDCNCSICAGFCDFEWFPDLQKISGNTVDPTIGVNVASNGTARIYFFDYVDVDDKDHPIFYIDENVIIPEGDDEIKIPAGEYDLNISSGSITLNGKVYNYNSYIDVTYTE